MIRRTLIALAALCTAASAAAQAFPDRPVRVIVPFAGGNTLDTAMRQVGEVFRANTGQSLIVDNRPGGGGIIAAQALMQSPANGYTVLLANTSMLTINPHTFTKLPYDAERSFRPITNFLGASMVMAVNAQSVPAANVAEFVAWAKPRGEKVSFASFTAGNSSHFAGVIMNQIAGLSMTHVPFNGTPPAVQDLVGGQVNAAFLPRLAVRPHMETGRVRVLAVTSPTRSSLMPDVATFREQGMPELEIYIWAALVAPAGTPDAAIARLNAEFVRALRSQTIQEQWRTMDFEPLPSTPEELSRFVQAESKRWGEAVRLSGFKAAE
jgi:tripartite-type tricarboxylate transporter receptor subunit TctC